MGRRLAAAFTLGFLALIPRHSQALEESKRVVILPLEVYGEGALAPLRAGLADLLASQIAADARVELAKPAAVEAAMGRLGGRPLDETAVETLAGELGAAAVWGSLTGLGKSTSLVLKLTQGGDRRGTRRFAAIAATPDDVLPRLAALAVEARQALLGGGAAPALSVPSPTSAAPMAPAPMAPAPMTPAPMAPAPPGAGDLFPFRGSTVWALEDLPFAVRGMAVGDVDGDGRNEVVLIDKTNVYVYRCQKRGQLLLAATAVGKGYESYISVAVEARSRRIFVTSMRDRPHSCAMEYRDGTLVPVTEDIPFFLRRVDGVAAGEVLGQELAGSGWPFQGDIFRVVAQGADRYVRGETVDLPKGFALYHFSAGDLKGDGGEEYVAVDGDGRLLVYSASKELLAKGRDGYGASCVGWQRPARRGDTESAAQETITIPPPVVAVDLDADGARELLAVRNPAKGWSNFFASGSGGAQLEGLKWEQGRLTSLGVVDVTDGCIPAVSVGDIDGDGLSEVLVASVALGATPLQPSHSSIQVYSRR